MSEDKQNGAQAAGVNPGYAEHQLAKALTTAEEHPDPTIRQRAEKRLRQWQMVFRNILSGHLAYGSRTPIPDAPTWATPEVVTGGFATGQLLASGPLRPHEVSLLESLPNIETGAERAALNAHFVVGEGLAQLSQMLANRCYDVELPEEGALLAVAWLAENGRAEAARSLLEQLAPYISKLRFYPVPRSEPRSLETRVHLQTVAESAHALQTIRPNERILAQKESVNVWAPFHDRVVALFQETVQDTWPCRIFPGDWPSRAKKLLDEYTELRTAHTLCRKMDRPNQHYRQLRDLLAKCASDPASLTGKEVGRIRLILTQYQQKRGTPGSTVCGTSRQKQANDVAAPTFHAVAVSVLPRLSALPQDEGVDDVDPLCGPITTIESTVRGVAAGTPLPLSVRRRIERCLNETVEALVERGFITSGDTLARLLPQITSAIRSASFADPQLQWLYRAIYRAFRQRRSLLLLNLEKQVQIEELPWIKVMEPLRDETAQAQDRAKNTLAEATTLTLTSFPYAIIPNKLLQELRALAKGAQLDLPLVDEVAADIFMGRFSDKFVDAAKRAAAVLDGTLYATYYRIDCSAIKALPSALRQANARPNANTFAELCVHRANVSLVGWDTVRNGMVIEQQQILTTQNLAVLCSELGLTGTLRDRFPAMARTCLTWIFRRQQTDARDWHARLVILKNTAYAWRQMLFFLSFVPPAELAAFVEWAKSQFQEQPEDFQLRFRPAFTGLVLASEGKVFDDDAHARRFLGWSKERHWLLPEPAGHQSR